MSHAVYAKELTDKVAKKLLGNYLFTSANKDIQAYYEKALIDEIGPTYQSFIDKVKDNIDSYKGDKYLAISLLNNNPKTISVTKLMEIINETSLRSHLLHIFGSDLLGPSYKITVYKYSSLTILEIIKQYLIALKKEST